MRRIALAAALALTACSTDAGRGAVDPRCEPPPLPTATATGSGAMSLVGVDNGLLLGFTEQPLSTAALAGRGDIRAALGASENLRGFMEKLVSCALPVGASVTVESDGASYSFDGLIGLAPEWASAACDEACQEWVSACIVARINGYGVQVEILGRADHPAIAPSAAEVVQFPVEEGAFFGNFFLDPPRAYACRGRSYDPLALSFRICTRDGETCGVQALGPCGALDGDTGRASARHVCEGYDETHGTYTRCHNRPSLPGSDLFPEPSRTYSRVITVQLRRTSIGRDYCGSLASRDAGPDLDSTAPDASVPVAAEPGGRCTTDDDCASATLVCAVAGPSAPVCTTECARSDDPAEESITCGDPRATCLESGDGDGAIRRCTRACRAMAPRGSEEQCADHQLCTGFWFTHASGRADTPGCIEWCRSDEDCARGAVCNPRTGFCGLPSEGTAEDGTPCGPGDTRCRGTCLPAGTGPTDGLCASFVDMTRGGGCPDAPARMRPLAPANDAMGVCIFRTCSTDSDCESPLRCLPDAAAGRSLCKWR